MNTFGFFTTIDDVIAHVDEKWHPDDFDLIIHAISNPDQRGAIISTPKSQCLICGVDFEVEESDNCWKAGWQWPFRLRHYMVHHHVRLPSEMVEMIRKSD